MPTLTLCADDFAFSSDTSRVIADLLAARRLTATGCMTVRPNWREDSRMLRDVPADRAIGLHLVLTDEVPLTAMPRLAPGGELPHLHRLERLSGSTLPLDELAAEIDAQFDAFAQAMGRPPAFVDGHQHAHALPAIREVVLAAVRRHAPAAWLRTCEERLGAVLARP
ncbi:ChbG/HpnK family deacetylase, partial [Sphingomonas bacterium]|uniref:ChbG/HpnK family deacetylase n=1 Tax=Sphingomonas bacterium TaxID=1895847 RepID=UPI001576C75C